MANDYLERSYAGWPRSYPGGAGPDGRDALAYSPAGFIWTDAAAHGKTVADFGEFTAAHHVWKNTRQAEGNWTDAYRDFISGADQIDYSCEPDIEALRPFIVTNYPGFDLNVPDIFRASRFIQDLKQFAAADNFPNLLIVWLPDDLTRAARVAVRPPPKRKSPTTTSRLGRLSRPSAIQNFGRTPVFLPSKTIRKTAGITKAPIARPPMLSVPTPNAIKS